MTTATIQPYLFFGGRCEEAIEFYRKGLGAEVEMLVRHDESPEPIPPGMLQPGFENKVMHSTLRIGGAVLMAADGSGEKSQFDGFNSRSPCPLRKKPVKPSRLFPREARCSCRLAKRFGLPVSAWSPTALASAGWCR